MYVVIQEKVINNLIETKLLFLYEEDGYNTNVKTIVKKMNEILKETEVNNIKIYSKYVSGKFNNSDYEDVHMLIKFKNNYIDKIIKVSSEEYDIQDSCELLNQEIESIDENKIEYKVLSVCGKLR